MASFRAEVEIAAPPAVVFAHLATAGGLTAWLGREAELEPVVGGRFRVDIGGAVMTGQVLALEPPTRLVLSWGLAGSPDFPPGASRLTFTLAATDQGTHVALAHTNLPETRAATHAIGWEHFLPRLRQAATGGRPEPEDWTPGAAGQDPV